MSGLPGLKTVGLLGGGVIGGAWAARFALNGVDVKLYDIDPQATRKMGEIMGNARRAYRKLTLAPLPQEGTITFVSTPEEAVTDVDFVQESAPERLELKQELLHAQVKQHHRQPCLVHPLLDSCQHKYKKTWLTQSALL